MVDRIPYEMVSGIIEADGVLARHKNLVIKNNTTNPNYQVDIDIDAILLDGHKVVRDINLTVDVTVSGANGLDTGVEANNTWYHLWVIYNPVTNITAGLLSTSSSVPTMPSGYTYKGYVGAIYNNGSGDFNETRQKNKVVISTDITDVNAGSAGTLTAFTLSIPETATFFGGYMNGDADADEDFVGILAPTSAPLGQWRLSGRGINTSSIALRNGFWLPVYESQTFYYAVTAGDGCDVNTNKWGY